MKVVVNSLRAQILLFGGTKIAAVTSREKKNCRGLRALTKVKAVAATSRLSRRTGSIESGTHFN